MKLARYIGNGQVAIVEEDEPQLPEGGLLVQTEACGLCSGELMEWYMDRKVPHVLGHEVSGVVLESDDERFPVGSRVFPHHHAPCLHCDSCKRGLYVHCPQWKATKLIPGGMAEVFAVPKENLSDTIRTDDLRPRDAALIEPLACIAKSIRLGIPIRTGLPTVERPWHTAVIGLGAMGILHMLGLPKPVGYELNSERVAWAKTLGLEAKEPSQHEGEAFDTVFVCPGNPAALDLATQIIAPGGTIVLFAPMPPGTPTLVDLNSLYFKDVYVVSSYSCGPSDTQIATQLLKAGKIKAEQVVSDFIALDELPEAYQAMKKGEILKAMVMFS